MVPPPAGFDDRDLMTGVGAGVFRRVDLLGRWEDNPLYGDSTV